MAVGWAVWKEAVYGGIGTGGGARARASWGGTGQAGVPALVVLVP